MPHLHTSEPEPSPIPDAWFRSLFAGAPTPMAVLHPQRGFVLVNRAFALFLGRTEAELRGMRPVDVTHPEDAALTTQGGARLRAGAPLDLEKRYIRPDGTVVWGRVTGTPCTGPDGTPSFLLSIEDLSARKATEAKLRDRERELGGFFDEAPFGMAVNAPDGRFIKVNPALCELVGYGREELLTLRWIDLVHPLDRDASRANLARQNADDAWERDVVRRLVTGEGHTVWLRCKAHVVCGDDGTPSYCVGQLIDLTPARVQEEERRLLEDHLLRSQRTETMGRIAGGLVHDFNNMLAVILNVAEIARIRATEPRGREYAEQIHSAATRAAALSRRLMSFGRPDTLGPEPIALNALLGESRHIVQRVIGEDISLTLDLAPDLPPVRAVRSNLEQALFNLFVNARDAMPTGGALVIRTRHVPVGDPGASDLPAVTQPLVLVEVADTGTGIPSGAIPHLFEPFFTTKEPGRGTGLGLSIVQHVVSEAGGSVRLHTREGEGTVFTVLLPGVTHEHTEHPTSLAASAHRGRGERVLVVEDEGSLLDLAVQLLAENGYVPLPAPGAQTAIELARQIHGRIDLLLTDVVMPGMSGPRLAAALRVSHPEARVLLMSGHPDERLGGHAATEARVLRKPFSADDLLSAVRGALDARPL